MLIKEKNLCEIVDALPHYELRFIFALINIILAIIAACGNALIITAVLKSHKLRDQPPTCFIISLSMADLLVGLIVQPAFSIMLFDWSNRTCSTEPYKLFLGFFMCSVSICSAMQVCLDRMCRICEPFWYDLHVTKRRAIIAVIGSWVSGCGVGYISAYNFPTKRMVAYGTLLWISTAIITGVVCSIRIYKVASKQIKEIAQVSFEKRRKVERERKLAVSLICVLATIIVCWLPYAIVHVCTMFFYTSDNWQTFWLIRLCTITLGYSNSTFNIFIFSFKNREVKKAIRTLLGIKKKEKHEEVKKELSTKFDSPTLSRCNSWNNEQAASNINGTVYGTVNNNFQIDES